MMELFKEKYVNFPFRAVGHYLKLLIFLRFQITGKNQNEYFAYEL